MRQGLTFDDVLLVPQYSNISSRFNGEIDLSIEILPGIEITYPLISANMDSITGPEMANEMIRLGGLGIIHRFQSINEHYEQLNLLPEGKRIACVGIGYSGQSRAIALASTTDAFLIDVAHGHTKGCIDMVKFLRDKCPDHPIIAGNVATYQGAMSLLNAGVYSIKCGVGNGSLCETRVRTGCGIPQLTAIMECVRAIDEWDGDKSTWVPTLISDGGVRNSGDCVKALAQADCVMSGALFAGTSETPGKVISLPDGKKVKLYRGSASYDAQTDRGKINTSVEGVATLKPFRGPLKEVFQAVVNGMLSGMSYQGCRSISELHEAAEFILQTQAGYIEATPHGANP